MDPHGPCVLSRPTSHAAQASAAREIRRRAVRAPHGCGDVRFPKLPQGRQNLGNREEVMTAA
jgi:hypothetical protein